MKTHLQLGNYTWKQYPHLVFHATAYGDKIELQHWFAFVSLTSDEFDGLLSLGHLDRKL